MAKLKITRTESSNGQIHDRYTSPNQINSAFIGGTGGLTSQTGRQIQPTVKVGSNGATTGSITEQKGSHKFRVTDGTNTSTCTLVNLATPTAADTMSIAITVSTIVGANLSAANVAGGATSTYMTFTTGNVSGVYSSPVVGQVITGFTNANAATVTVTALNSTVAGLSNVTVSVTGNIAAESFKTVTDTRYATRITNRFVYDFSGAKWRYHLATEDSTFVKVAYA